MPIEPIVDSIIDLIEKNLVAVTNLTSNVTTGDLIVNVENSLHFKPNQEIIFKDYGYDIEGDPHYTVWEYSKIRSVNNTRSITLTSPIISNWLVSNGSSIQKTIGHSPLYSDQIYYGDREVIPTDLMAVTVDPTSVSNEWLYLQGGLEEDYKVKIMVYGKDIKTDEGTRILNRYSDAITQLLNENIHLPVANYTTPLYANASIGDSVIVIEDTPDNRSNIILSNLLVPMLKTMKLSYQVQDNLGVSWWSEITNISYAGGLMYLTIDPVLPNNFKLSEFAVLKKLGGYVYDSRADAATYGVVSKGSAILRAAEISWYGKQINEFSFPQKSLAVDTFEEVEESSSSSSSSSSGSDGL